MSGDLATVSVHVAVPREAAFEVFTQEINLWWRTGPKYRVAGKRRGALYFEPGMGGRLFETFDDVQGSRTHEVGRVTSWDPPSRLELEWRGMNYAPGEKTFVEVSFEPVGRGTLVTVRHRGFAALPADHPVRHGLVGGAFSRMLGMWWGDVMRGLREHVAGQAPEES